MMEGIFAIVCCHDHRAYVRRGDIQAAQLDLDIRVAGSHGDLAGDLAAGGCLAGRRAEGGLAVCNCQGLVVGRGFGEHVVAVAGGLLKGVPALERDFCLGPPCAQDVADFVVVRDLFSAQGFQVGQAADFYRVHGTLDAFAGDCLFALVIGGAVHVDVAGLALQGSRADPVHCPVLVGIELVVRDVHQDIRGLLPDGDLFIIISQTICLKTILSNIGNSIYGLT